MFYNWTRAVLKFICRVTGQQCSGRQRRGYAAEWCKYKGFHSGICANWQGEEFTYGNGEK